ncbi:hypothetical protein C1J03_19615 [Sulfitobacter sp. SK012]|uniref:glycosyltransferase family 2 protein n=1 Tax=Sulfitobacter sp. SK012 TaxID=1389005 RepID=UPI000E0AFA82|nr:glycosyltransferase family 2 protein [Sulfitobacter sp. SK012]AXI48012.1 hypothetical protein C1J03_19615 [Sulfitobacter sp. SK012]
MLPFAPHGDARLAYRADFRHDRYCNLSLFDLSRRNILFHLSLRADTGTAVVNRRKGEVWAREQHRNVAMPDSGVNVVLEFKGPSLSVQIDGTEAFRFANRFTRPFPGMRGAGYADFYGGLLGPTLEMDVRVADALGDGPALRLDQRLMLRGVQPADQQLALGLPDMPLPLKLITETIGAEQHLRSIIPGRIWQAISPDAPLTVYVGGTSLTITRAALAARITTMLEDGPELKTDALAAAQVIEHVRFAGLMPILTQGARAKLVRLAHGMKLDGFLSQDTTTSAPLPSPPAPEHDAKTEARFRAEHDALSAFVSNATSPFGAYLAANAPPKGQLRKACLALTELACNTPDPTSLRDLSAAAKTLGLGKMPDLTFPWEVSALLPWRWLEGDHAGLPTLINRLTENSDDWIMTPPLAWVMQRVAAEDVPFDTAPLINAYAAFLEAQSTSYWGRSNCAALIDATADLLAARDRFEPDTAQQIETLCLKVYALTPAFWSALAAREPELSPALIHARDAFAALQSGAPTQRHLDSLAKTDCIDLPRFRRDFAVPTQTITGEAALRHLAHPETPEDAAQDTSLTTAARECMPSLYAETSINADAAKTEVTTRAAQTLLDDPSQTHLLDYVKQLNGMPDEALASGLNLSVVAALLQGNHHAEANALWQETPDSPLQTDQPALEHAQALLTRSGNDPLAKEALKRWSHQAASLPATAMLSAGLGLHNTVVTVFSCEAHLDTRIPQMRRGWLSDLAAIGVPYVIIIGGGTDPKGVLAGDVLRLQAADDYEGLPEKTLAAVRWVHEQTQFGHLYKVDDDCFVNVPTLFDGLPHLKFDYYGRPLILAPGQMDRGWHVAKSTSPRGRLELDKSPEPSRYADGGSGYMLSRRAMGAALSALETPQGQALLQSSFMEDKLLGDLLSLKGISVEGEDYLITVRRREASGGIAVPRWVNGFDASQTAPVKLVHLDDPAAQDAAYARLKTPILRPAKIWPSFQNATLGPHSNALEMISPPDRLDLARNASVAVVACVRNEMFMLPHFLAHYRSLGVKSFLIADNCSDDGTLEYLAEQPDVALFTVDTEYSRSYYGVAWQQALISNFRVGKWSLMADADELLVWQHPQRQSLPDLLAEDDFADADAVRIFMLDMYPRGPLAAADFTNGDPFSDCGFTENQPFLTNATSRGPFSNSRTWTSAVRHRLIPGSRPELFVAQKLALLRYQPWMRPTAGLHYVGGTKPADRELLFAHFKYNADFRRKALAEVARGQHFNDAEEYRKYLAVVSEGRDVIYENGISVPWTDSDFVRARLTRQD